MKPTSWKTKNRGKVSKSQRQGYFGTIVHDVRSSAPSGNRSSHQGRNVESTGISDSPSHYGTG